MSKNLAGTIKCFTQHISHGRKQPQASIWIRGDVGIPAEKLSSLTSSVEIHEVQDGETVFSEGDAGDRFYIIVHGKVRVETKTKSSVETNVQRSCSDNQTNDEGSSSEDMTSLGTLGTGNYFGEMALVTDSPRSATVTSNGKTILLSVGKESFHNIFDVNSPALAEFELRLLQGSAQLHHLLAHSTGMDSFRSFLRKGLAEENLDFWVRVKEFSCSEFKSSDDMAIVARQLFNSFCDENSEQQVNLPCSLRSEIQTVLEDGNVTKDMFDCAQAEIYRLMVRDNYAQFKASSDFKDVFKSLGILIGER